MANTGPDAATGVTVTDTLPDDVTFASASDGGTQAGGVVTWSGLTVPAGGSTPLTVVVNVDADAPGGATLTNSATVTAGNETDPNPANNIASTPVTVNSLVDVEVTKTVSDPTPNVGETVTYTITATNVAGNATATGVTITDVLPAGVTLAGAATVPAGTTSSGGVWSIPTLAPGTSKTLTIPVTINGAGGNDHRQHRDPDRGRPAGYESRQQQRDGVAHGQSSAGRELHVRSPPCSTSSSRTRHRIQTAPIASWSWDFGDGTSPSDTSTGQNPTHTYPASGTYTVTLTVTDNRGGTNSISQPVEVRFEEAVFCSDDPVPADDVATTGPAAQEATFTRGDNNDGGGVTQIGCEDIGVTLQIDEDGVFLDKGTVGILTGDPQDVNSTLDITWTPLVPVADAADLDREINFFPDEERSSTDVFVPVQWCLSSALDGETPSPPCIPPHRPSLARAGHRWARFRGVS